MGSIKVLYFAWLRERVGCGAEDVALPEDASVGGLIAALRARGGGYERAFAQERVVRAAVNQVFAFPETAVAAGDEVAFFPPVTGG